SAPFEEAAATTGDAPQYGDTAATSEPAAGAATADAMMTQQATVAPPPPAASDPANWLIGMWQGPSLGCPPGGGLEFVPGETRSYYQGRIAAVLKATYEVSGDLVTVVTTGIDGVGRAYQYQRTGPETFMIASVPAEMPKSMIGVEHRRCASAPFAAAAVPAQEAPATQPAIAAAPASTQPTVPAAKPQAAATAQPAATAAPATATPGTSQAGWNAFGRGDYAGALAVWQPLAEQGDVAMQLLVGSIYDYGQGVPQDDAEAIKWYEMAANRGSAKGQYQAGAVYARSPQIKNNVEGYKWLTIAARTLGGGGDVQSGISADQAKALRAELEHEMSAAEIAKAQKEADAFRAKKS
ncbi:MAG: tetratricopeptide repeat protein, partial [Dongiaceae bacterium]